MNKSFIFCAGLICMMSYSSLGKALQVGFTRELLNDIKAETKKCAVQVVNGNGRDRTVMGFRSTCPSLKIASMAQAQIFIEGQWYLAKIAESTQSDGGDLDDLYIYDSRGQLVAKKLNVPAYDSVVVAMAGTSDLRTR